MQINRFRPCPQIYSKNITNALFPHPKRYSFCLGRLIYAQLETSSLIAQYRRLADDNTGAAPSTNHVNLVPNVPRPPLAFAMDGEM